jgi:hypothetical protein
MMSYQSTIIIFTIMSIWFIMMNSKLKTQQNLKNMLHIYIFYLILTPMADWQLHYVINAMVLILQSTTFLFYVVIYHFHLLMVYVSQLIRYTRSCITYEDFSNWGKLLTKDLMLQGYNESLLKSSFRKFWGGYIDLVCDITYYHWLICWMICFTFFVRLSFPYLLWWRVIPYPIYLILTKGSRRVWPVSRGCLLLHGTGSYLRICRRSELPCTGDFLCVLWIMITFYKIFCIL